MEKEYTQPEIELITLSLADIIITSDEDEGPLLPPDPDETTDPTGPETTESTTDEDEGPRV